MKRMKHPRPRALRASRLNLALWGLGTVALDLWQMHRVPRRPTLPEAALPSFAAWPARLKVSVIVAAWNEAAHIDALVTSFERLVYPAKELLLCAGGDDGTFARAAAWSGPRVKVIEQWPREGKQRALQRALERATGDVVYLTDADCELSDAAFLAVLEPVATRVAPAATGLSEPKSCQRHEPLVQYQWFSDAVWAASLAETTAGVLGRNCALTRAALDAIGGFTAPAPTGTDYVLSRRLVQAGIPIRAVPASRVQTEYPATPSGYLRMWRRWNKNLLVHGPTYQAWQDLKGLAAATAIYGFTLGLPFLAPLAGPVAPLASLTLLSWASAKRVQRSREGARLAGVPFSWRLAARIPFYTVIDMLAVLLAIRDSARVRTRVQW